MTYHTSFRHQIFIYRITRLYAIVDSVVGGTGHVRITRYDVETFDGLSTTLSYDDA